jgi:apolipoprotein N-acyltransferase
LSPTVTDRLRKLAASGRLWAWVHGVGVLVWVGLSVPGMTVWRQSVPFLVMVSLYAIILSHAVGAVSALAARKADPSDPV